MSQTLDASKHYCTTEHFNRENYLRRVQDTRPINNLFSDLIISMLTSQFCFLSPIRTHSVHSCIRIKQHSWMLKKKNTIHEHTLPSTKRRCKIKRQKKVTLCATGSCRYSINILKNSHRKILENTSLFFRSVLKLTSWDCISWREALFYPLPV